MVADEQRGNDSNEKPKSTKELKTKAKMKLKFSSQTQTRTDTRIPLHNANAQAETHLHTNVIYSHGSLKKRLRNAKRIKHERQRRQEARLSAGVEEPQLVQT